MAALQVIFDTNVLFSAIGWRGAPWRCVELARAGRLVGFSCDALMQELADKLAEKLKFSPAEVLAVTEDLLSFLRLVPNPAALPGVCRDPDDDWVLALAVAVPVNRIVSGDRDLLVLRQFATIPIVSPRDFLSELERPPAV